MSRIFVTGLGAVSPAGWGLPALRTALEKSEPLPTQWLAMPPRSGDSVSPQVIGNRGTRGQAVPTPVAGNRPRAVRQVPNPVPRPAFMAHPRLRRTSPISQYAAGAAWEALEKVKGLAGDAGSSRAQKCRVGIVMCLYCGCIQHSYRFYDEVLQDPLTASPLVFPETVFAAPASHLAGLFELTPLVTTLVGDPATLLQGFALAADWLLQGWVDLCLVVGAEETNWLLADALWHFDHGACLSGGAGAFCLSADPADSLGVELELITSVHTFAAGVTRASAAEQMRRELAGPSEGYLLCDGVAGTSRFDASESAAWADWTGARLSPKKVLGEGLMAAAAWQCVAGSDAVAQHKFPAALVSLVGCNQQAIGARFAVHSAGI